MAAMAAAAGADSCKAETTHTSAPASPATAAPAAPPPPPHAMVLESAESQVQRAAARQAAAEARVHDLSTPEGVAAVLRARDKADAAVEAADCREAAVRAERAAVAARADANAAEKKRLVAALASAGADRELSAGKEMESVKRKREQLEAELELVRAEGNVLRTTLSGMDRVVAAAGTMGHKARMACEDALVLCWEAQKAADNLARVHALCKENTAGGTVAVAAACSSNDNREPRQVPVVVRLPSLVQPSRQPMSGDGLRPSDEDAPCPVCDRWFFCGDTLRAHCGCTYHLHCAALWFGQAAQKRCCRSECGGSMHPAWLAAWGQGWDSDDEGAAIEGELEEKSRRWRQEARSRLSSSTSPGHVGGAAAAAEACSSTAPAHASPSHDVDADSASSPSKPDCRTTLKNKSNPPTVEGQRKRARAQESPKESPSDHKQAQPHSDDCLVAATEEEQEQEGAGPATEEEQKQDGAGPKPLVTVPEEE